MPEPVYISSPQTGTIYSGPKEQYPGPMQTGASPNAQAWAQYQASHPRDPMQEQLAYAQMRQRMLANVGLQQPSTQQAEQAVYSAIKLQGIRGYQKDIQSGTPAAEALAKWAPAMFAGPKGIPASAMKAMNPPQEYQFVPGTDQIPPTFRSPGRAPVIVHQPSLATGRMSDIDSKRYARAQKELDVARKEIEGSGWFGRTADAKKRVEEARSIMNEIEQKYSGASGPQNVSAPESPSGETEVIRVTKDGRRAIFDAATRKFLRYAQ